MLTLLLLACGGKAPPEPAPVAPTPEVQPAVKPEADPSCTLSSCLPVGMQDLPLGTPRAAFLEAHPQGGEDDAVFPFRHVYELPVEGQPYALVVYYFDADLPDQPLYEVIIQYPDGADVVGVAEELLGPANNGEEWSLPLEGESVPLNAWVYEQKLIYAVPWLGTEWNPFPEEEQEPGPGAE